MIKSCFTFALVLIVVGCNTTKTSATSMASGVYAASSSSTQSNVSDSEVVAKMKSAGNPYSTMYGEWDWWIANNIVWKGRGRKASERWDLKEGETVAATLLDTSGFLVPLEEHTKNLEDHKKTTSDRDSFAAHDTWVYAVGKMPDDLAYRMKEAVNRVKVTFYPSIPNWLVEKDFQAVTVLNDGRVILDHHTIYGHTGSPKRSNNVSTYELYSSTGQLLGSTTDSFWWSLFGVEVDISRWPPGSRIEQTDDGYFKIISSSSAIIEVLDFDGSILKTTDPPRRDPHHFALLTRNRALAFITYQK